MKQSTKYLIALSAVVLAIFCGIKISAAHNSSYKFRSVEDRLINDYRHQAWSDSVDAVSASHK